jgi:putative ABC transport system substrate-binding protein
MRIASFIVVAFTVMLLVAPPTTEAQPAKKVYRLGILSLASPTPPGTYSGTLHVIDVLRELGYVVDQNLAVEGRYAEGRADRLPGLAQELVQLRVDVILAIGTAVEAAKEATKTIPIVMGLGPDPVGQGFVASLARPGGNITGDILRGAGDRREAAGADQGSRSSGRSNRSSRP